MDPVRGGYEPSHVSAVRWSGLREPLDHERVKKARTRLFGSWEMNWMAYNFGHDVALPGSSGRPVGYFMYPQGETAAGRLDPFDPDAFRYQITSKELPSANG